MKFTQFRLEEAFIQFTLITSTLKEGGCSTLSLHLRCKDKVEQLHNEIH